MEATRSISELKQYLDKFKKDMSEIDIRHLEEIPKFSIPNWPKQAGEVKINLWFRLGLRPIGGKQSNLLNLRRRLFRRVWFKISETGVIEVCQLRLFSSWYESPNWASNSDDSMQRTMCFIVLGQFLDQLCSKVIERLKKRYSGYKREADEFNRVCEAVKRSFEPLIPFVVADILSDTN